MGKKILKWTFRFILLLVLLFGGFLGYMTIADYKPAAIEDVEVRGTISAAPLSDTLTFISWNIGYCGLGAEQDFFFDGGKGVRPNASDAERYRNGVLSTIASLDTNDFILLQEVDLNSKRSYYKNQVQMISEKMPQYVSGFAKNYDSKFIPQPLSNPYGKAVGGILSLSRYKPAASRRHALAQDAAWPMGLFMLKRCYLEWRFLMRNGKDLVVINQHLSAYDDGTVKQQQMDTLRKKLNEEYAAGNYVVAGGDWNQFPPGYQPSIKGKDDIVDMNVSSDYPGTGWKWAFDAQTTTNRRLNAPYSKGMTEEVVIDYFLLSPNVTLLDVKGIPLEFRHSDHQPVYMRVAIGN